MAIATNSSRVWVVEQMNHVEKTNPKGHGQKEITKAAHTAKADPFH